MNYTKYLGILASILVSQTCTLKAADTLNVDESFVRQHMAGPVFRLETDRPVRISGPISARGLVLDINAPTARCDSDVLVSIFMLKTKGNFVNTGNVRALRDISIDANAVTNGQGSRIHSLGSTRIKALTSLINEGSQTVQHPEISFKYYTTAALPGTAKTIDSISRDPDVGLEKTQIAWPALGPDGKLARVIPTEQLGRAVIDQVEMDTHTARICAGRELHIDAPVISTDFAILSGYSGLSLTGFNSFDSIGGKVMSANGTLRAVGRTWRNGSLPYCQAPEGAIDLESPIFGKVSYPEYLHVLQNSYMISSVDLPVVTGYQPLGPIVFNKLDTRGSILAKNLAHFTLTGQFNPGHIIVSDGDCRIDGKPTLIANSKTELGITHGDIRISTKNQAVGKVGMQGRKISAACVDDLVLGQQRRSIVFTMPNATRTINLAEQMLGFDGIFGADPFDFGYGKQVYTTQTYETFWTWQ